MIEYATLVSGSAAGFLRQSLYGLTQWFDGIPNYWVAGGAVLLFWLLYLFIKKV